MSCVVPQRPYHGRSTSTFTLGTQAFHRGGKDEQGVRVSTPRHENMDCTTGWGRWRAPPFRVFRNGSGWEPKAAAEEGTAADYPTTHEKLSSALCSAKVLHVCFILPCSADVLHLFSHTSRDSENVRNAATLRTKRLPKSLRPLLLPSPPQAGHAMTTCECSSTSRMTSSSTSKLQNKCIVVIGTLRNKQLQQCVASARPAATVAVRPLALLVREPAAQQKDCRNLDEFEFMSHLSDYVGFSLSPDRSIWHVLLHLCCSRSGMRKPCTSLRRAILALAWHGNNVKIMNVTSWFSRATARAFCTSAACNHRPWDPAYI